MSNINHLSGFFQLHDRVVMAMDKEARYFGRKGRPDGTKGTVIGFKEVVIDRPYGGGYKKPGMYITRGLPLIKWDCEDKAEYCGDVNMQDTAAYEQRIAEARKELEAGSRISAKVNPEVYFDDLPDSPFMVGDTVHVRERWKYADRKQPYEYVTTIQRVDYYKMYHKYTRTDGSEWPYYDVVAEGGAGTTTHNTQDLTLIKRGNLFHYYKGDKKDIVFKDLQDEVKFNSQIGRVNELRNPDNGLYRWTLAEILQGIEQGTVDGLRVSQMFFDSEPRNCALYIEDRELAARVRKETLKGFKIKS